ncbi:MAG: response regulator transcription factor, partial [Chloroflexi bacterium]|nr:response regulator transcription factor [Chloroflexota bacterium]
DGDWLTRTDPSLIVLDGQSDVPSYDPWLLGQQLLNVTPCPIVLLLPISHSPTQCRDALRMGMADCLCRPFHLPELVARIQRIIWRMTEANTGNGTLPRLSVDPYTQTAAVNGTIIHLTRTEFRLLYALFLHPGEFVPYDMIQEMVWDDADPGKPNRLRQLVWQLRQKLEANPRTPRLIITEPSQGGYSLHT